MSRSYKKTPVIKGTCGGMKKFASRRVRRTKIELADGNAYKKVFPSCDISDFVFRRTWQEEVTFNKELYNRELTEEELKKIRNEWEKYYKRK